MGELLIILLIALLVFGSKKLRTVGADLGAAVHSFKKAMNEGDDGQARRLADAGSKDAEFPERSAAPSKHGA